MANQRYDGLKIKNQICFPLYVCSRELIKRYKPFLDKVDLTYTQYLTMTVLWEEGEVTSKELGNRLYLDSGTLTPLLKKLESKGLLTRERSREDERNLRISLTAEGEALKEKALSMPEEMEKHVNLTNEEKQELYRLLHKLLEETAE